MGLLGLADFLIERPTLTAALVWGSLYLLKKKRTPRHGALSKADKDHVLEVHREQLPYAETMYDLPEEEHITEGHAANSSGK